MPSKRLKHFCELCRKQCKDQNGFKCHINSQSHQLRVREYASNPLEHIEKASKEFEWRFIQMLKSKYAGEPKYLEELYNQLIQEKKFLKFNHTQWKNLAEFGNHLQTVKNIKVIGTPPNCKVVYLVSKTKDFIQSANKEKAIVQREKEKEQFQKSIALRIQKEKEYAEKQEALLNFHIEQLKKENQQMQIPDRLQLTIEGFNEGVKRSAFFTTEELEKQVKEEESIHKKKVDKIEKLYQKLKKNNQKPEEEEVEWIHPGIIVRIKPHQIQEVFHSKKGKITRIVQPFIAEVQVGTALIQIDQTNIETVIPKVGHQVMLLNGEYQGKTGVLKEVHLNKGFGVIEIDETEVKVAFNLFSKVDQ